MAADDDVRELYRLLRDLTANVSAVAAKVEAHIAREEAVDSAFKNALDGLLAEIQNNHKERNEALVELHANIKKFDDALSRIKGGGYVLLPLAMAIGWAIEHFGKWKS